MNRATNTQLLGVRTVAVWLNSKALVSDTQKQAHRYMVAMRRVTILGGIFCPVSIYKPDPLVHKRPCQVFLGKESPRYQILCYPEGSFTNLEVDHNLARVHSYHCKETDNCVFHAGWSMPDSFKILEAACAREARLPPWRGDTCTL